MCDNDSDYKHISARDVIIRKPRSCGSCLREYPAGTPMRYHVGKTEGEFTTTHACPTCNFMAAQTDGSPLHICWGDLWEDYQHQFRPYEYVKYCLENGETPTVTGLECVQQQFKALENV